MGIEFQLDWLAPGGVAVPKAFQLEWPLSLERIKRIMDAMSSKEKSAPRKIDAIRRQHLAEISGVQPEEVEQLIERFQQARNLMQQISGLSFWQRLKLMLGWSKLPME
jgi:signal recognition particle subunit SRP54